MALDGDTAVLVAEWRRKALEGTISDDEMREFIRVVREGRVSAAATSAKSRARKEEPNIDDVMGELDKLL